MQGKINAYGFWRENATNIRPGRSSCRWKNNINPLNAELNPICHFVALLGAHHIVHVSRIRVNMDLKYVEWEGEVRVDSFALDTDQ
jgi:hypothetical protein